jgi:hypothetical protein
VGSYVVKVSTPLPLPIDVPGTRKIGDNALGRTLGNFQQIGDVTDTDPRVTGDEEQRVAVVGEQPKIRNGAQGDRPLPGYGDSTDKVYPIDNY